MSDIQGITFTAIFQKVQTLVDGGWRVSFDVSHNDASQILALSSFRDMALQIAVVPTEVMDTYSGGFDGSR